MSCFFCDGPRVMSTYDAPHNGCQNVPIGTMTLMRGCDGEPMVKVELDTEIELSVSADGDMLAYEAVHCPKCGAIIERRA